MVGAPRLLVYDNCSCRTPVAPEPTIAAPDRRRRMCSFRTHIRFSWGSVFSVDRDSGLGEVEFSRTKVTLTALARFTFDLEGVVTDGDGRQADNPLPFRAEPRGLKHSPQEKPF
jgi:hypothetical protein